MGKQALGLTLLLLASACGDDSVGEPGQRPEAPVSADPAYVIGGIPKWALIENPATPGVSELSLSVTAPTGTRYIDVWLDNRDGLRLEAQDGQFVVTLPIANVAAGEHELRFAANGASVAFAAKTFIRSHPYYVAIATDWDFPDPSTPALDKQDVLHDNHPHLKITHFVGPYTFTTPTVDALRQEQLAAWLRANAADHHDEIALHIHPYCSFVEYAGVTCNTTESIVYANDATGYTINLSVYSQEDMAAMLVAVDSLFVEHNLPMPRSFRAGGWTAGATTLRALAEHGYVADSSALNWARLEEWDGLANGVLYDWNMAAWSSIDDVAQPYYPNVNSPSVNTAPTLSMLEIPDNAAMVDYVDTAEMTEIFEANWTGGALTTPRTFVAGLHPAASLSAEEVGRLDGICSVADLHLAANDDGPVVYATMSEISTAFAQ